MFRRSEFFCDTRGAVAVLAALVLPIVLFLFAVIVDMGTAFAVRSRLNTTAELAVQAGAVTVGDLIVTYAEAHNPPPEATDPLLYLTDDDIRAITADTSVSSVIQQYISMNRDGITGTPDVMIWYPDNTIYCDGPQDQRRIDIKVTIKETFVSMFPSVFLGTEYGAAEATAVQSIPICPI